ncbi:MAG: hypothetical protein ACXWW9_02480 [Actinomycetota bacterium]
MRITARSRWILLTSIAVLLVVAVGAAFAASTGDPDAPVSSGPSDDLPPGDGEPVLVEPRPGMTDVYARPFDTASVNDDGTSVTIDFVSGVEPCAVLDHVDVRYGADAVTITLYEGHDADAGDVACIEIGVFKRVVVHLDEPLGDREIVDGAAV